jgi:hypothetical protein
MRHGHERSLHPLSSDFPLTDFVNGDLCSIDRAGFVVPLHEALQFGGVLDGIGREQGQWKASFLIKGTISVPIPGLSSDTKLGCEVYAVRTGRDESFSLDGIGAEIGKLLSIDNMETGECVVGIRPSFTKEERT